MFAPPKHLSIPPNFKLLEITLLSPLDTALNVSHMPISSIHAVAACLRDRTNDAWRLHYTRYCSALVPVKVPKRGAINASTVQNEYHERACRNYQHWPNEKRQGRCGKKIFVSLNILKGIDIKGGSTNLKVGGQCIGRWRGGGSIQ